MTNRDVSEIPVGFKGPASCLTHIPLESGVERLGNTAQQVYKKTILAAKHGAGLENNAV